MSWWRDMLERWGWQPPQDEMAAKDKRAEKLHQAAIDVRVDFEASTARTRPLIARVERLADQYIKASASEARAAADYRAAEQRRRRRKAT